VVVTSDSDGNAVQVQAPGGAGSGAAGTSGANGRFVLGANNVAPFVGSVTAATQETFAGMTVINPFITVQSLAQTALIPDLLGGAEGFGLLHAEARDLTGLLAQAPANAVAALVLTDTSPTGDGVIYGGSQLLLFVNLTGDNLYDPCLGIGGAGMFTPLRQGGVNNCRFLPGDPGPIVLDQLRRQAIYATVVPNGLDIFNFAVQAPSLTPGGGNVLVSLVNQHRSDFVTIAPLNGQPPYKALYLLR